MCATTTPAERSCSDGGKARSDSAAGAGTAGIGERDQAWALVELFGHQRIVGYLSQQTFPSGVLFRVDVPDLLKDGKSVRAGFTRYFGLSAIYSITPVDEQTVRELLPMISGTPEARPLSLRSYGRGEREEGW
jgi:hypothetical protein